MSNQGQSNLNNNFVNTQQQAYRPLGFDRVENISDEEEEDSAEDDDDEEDEGEEDSEGDAEVEGESEGEDDDMIREDNQINLNGMQPGGDMIDDEIFQQNGPGGQHDNPYEEDDAIY